MKWKNQIRLWMFIEVFTGLVAVWAYVVSRIYVEELALFNIRKIDSTITEYWVDLAVPRDDTVLRGNITIPLIHGKRYRITYMKDYSVHFERYIVLEIEAIG